jgi:hypothetical protein
MGPKRADSLAGKTAKMAKAATVSDTCLSTFVATTQSLQHSVVNDEMRTYGAGKTLAPLPGRG